MSVTELVLWNRFVTNRTCFCLYGFHTVAKYSRFDECTIAMYAIDLVSLVASQEAEHAVGLLHYPVYMTIYTCSEGINPLVSATLDAIVHELL